jgi:peptide/histidine transporter 3/4
LLFALGIEFSECLAFFAISKNLVTYLTSVLQESNVDAARNVPTWIGTTFFSPLVGAFLADTYWGRYKTIVVFLSVYAVVSASKRPGAPYLPFLKEKCVSSISDHFRC